MNRAAIFLGVAILAQPFITKAVEGFGTYPSVWEAKKVSQKVLAAIGRALEAGGTSFIGNLKA